MVTIGAYFSEMAPKAMRGKAFACPRRSASAACRLSRSLAYLLVPTAPFGLEGWRWVVLIGAFAAVVLIGFLRRGCPKARAGSRGRAGSWRPIKFSAAHRSQGRRPNMAARCPRPGQPSPSPRRAAFGSLDPADPRARHPDEHLQYLPDRRLLRLFQLGAFAARQTRHHRIDQPRLHNFDRARGAGRTARSGSSSPIGSSANASSSPRPASILVCGLDLRPDPRARR